MKKMPIVSIAFVIFVILTVQVYAAPPNVVCVPWVGDKALIPHEAWSGREITLKGTAHDPDGDHELSTYGWDFGDGSPVVSGSVTNPYVIEAKHTYTGDIGDMFVATLKVTDTNNETGIDQYLIEIKDGLNLKVKVNVAIDEGLWRLHKDQVRGTLPDGTPIGYWPYPDGNTDIMTWTRDSGTAGDIIGAWHYTSDDGNLYDFTFNLDGSFNISGQIVEDCPGTYTASGTYNHDSNRGILTLVITSSDFVCNGPEVGTARFLVSSMTSTAMTLQKIDMVWTRDSGTAGDIIGAWHYTSDEGDLYDITFNSDSSFNISGQIIVDCPGTYTASGIYTYDSSTGILTWDITSSNFVCNGPEVGTARFLVSSLTSTTMTLIEAGGEWTVSATGASTESFEIHGSLPSGNPDENPYVETVKRGLNYLLSQMHSFTISQDITYCPMGNPDVNGNGIGLSCYTDYEHSMYEAGIALMAFASSKCPDCIAATGIPKVVGRKYLDIVQDMVDHLAYSQSDPVTGVFEGGWRYHGNYGESDNSVSQWPVIGMEAADVNFGSKGLVVPSFVKNELNLWINYIQNDISGGSGYMHPDNWVNVAKTGGLLCEMKFVGDTTTSSRVQNAIEFIYNNCNNWDTDPEHFAENSYYAFYSVMKGFRLLGIDTIHPINNPTVFDWYGDPVKGYAQHIVNDQNPDGAWYNAGIHSGHPLTGAWALLTLRKTVVEPGPVAVAGPDVPSHPPLIDITFDGTGSYHRNHPENSIVKYVWDFGDGSLPVEGPIVKYAFSAVFKPDGTIDWEKTAHCYKVTLTVFDDNEPPLHDEDSLNVCITPPPYPPVADANGPYYALPCETITLDGSGSYDPNGELYPDPSHPWHGYIVSWEWDLDNDSEYDDATGVTTTWSSCEPGIHVVGLKVTNNFEENNTDAVDVVAKVTEDIPNLWTINKQADQTDLVLPTGQTFMVNYKVTLDETSKGRGIDECVNVFDTLKGFLGTICDDKIFSYSMQIGPYDSCGIYTVENTATFVANDTGKSSSASWTVNVHVPCEGGCTLTPGYWKTHSKYGPAPYDDTWFMRGEDTMFFLSGQTWYRVLWTVPQYGNSYYILAHAYIAAYLNGLNSADTSAINNQLAHAVQLLSLYKPMDKLSKTVRTDFIDTAYVLDQFNNGYIGPGYCSE